MLARKAGRVALDYLYDGNNLLEEVDQSGNVVARNAQTTVIDEPLAMLEGSPTGGLLPQGCSPIHFSSQGASLTLRTSNYYYRARYYDQNSGRFLSEDPIQFRGGADFYAYVWNSPPNLSDPMGQFPTSWHRNNNIRHFQLSGCSTSRRFTGLRCM